MKICFDQNKTTIKVKVRRYPGEQRNFFDEHLTQLVELNFIKKCLQTARRAAPHLATKVSKAKFRTIIEFRSVIKATVVKQ